MNKLKSLVERMQRLNSEIKDLQSDKKELLLEVVNEGFDKKAFNEVIKRLDKDQDELSLFEGTVETYLTNIK